MHKRQSIPRSKSTALNTQVTTEIFAILKSNAQSAETTKVFLVLKATLEVHKQQVYTSFPRKSPARSAQKASAFLVLAKSTARNGPNNFH